MPDSTNPGDIQSVRRLIDVGIGSATTISSAIDLNGYRIAAIDWASGATAPNPLSFQVSQDATHWFNLFDPYGVEVTISSGSLSTAAAQSVAFDANLGLYLGAHRYVKIRQGVASAPATAGASAFSFGVVLVRE